MELIILDSDLRDLGVLDVFESVIWVDRFCGYGDFELYDQASIGLFERLRQDYYLLMRDSEHVMIVEGCKLNTDAENGNHMTFTGRSAESILDRRIIWTQTVISGNLQNGIQKLLNENAISPTNSERIIPNFIFEPSDDPAITSLTAEAQFTGTNLYEAIKKLCVSSNIGFKVTLSGNNLVFKLYSGTDRSYDQLANPYVVFSPGFENLANSNYSESKVTLKNVTLVAGEGEGLDRKTTTVGTGEGMSRREMFTDARDLSQTVDGVLISDSEYLSQLAQRGVEDLSENIFEQAFDGLADTSKMFKYGEDFFMGDIVQLANEYGIEGRAQVIEVIRSQSTSGFDVYPTFSMIS